MPIDTDGNDRLLRLYNLPLLEKRAIQELHGIAAPIVYDGVVDDQEIGFLAEWLTSRSEFADTWPFSELFELMEQLRPRRKIEPLQRLRLFEFLSGIASSADAAGRAGDSLFDDSPAIVFASRQFLFTGRLDMGSRSKAEAAVRSRGGTIARSPCRDLDFLVVGALGTEHWKYSRYGSKIEKVMENRRKGSGTSIVSERDFVRAVLATDSP